MRLDDTIQLPVAAPAPSAPRLQTGASSSNTFSFMPTHNRSAVAAAAAAELARAPLAQLQQPLPQQRFDFARHSRPNVETPSDVVRSLNVRRTSRK